MCPSTTPDPRIAADATPGHRLFGRGDGGHHTLRIPALTAAGPHLVAFAEGRRDSAGDAGEIVIMARVSSDGGRTWSAPVVTTQASGHTCGNPAPVAIDDDTVVLVSSRNAAAATEADIVAGRVDAEDGRRVQVQRISVPSLTATAPRDLTEVAKRPDWGWYATGPGHALRLQRGRYAGRIVVPANHSVVGSEEPSPYGRHTLISDDLGERWRIGLVDPGRPGCGGPNESTGTEVGDGDVVFSVRNQQGGEATRGWAISTDGGDSATPLEPQPIAMPRIEGSLATVRIGDREVVVLSGPSDPEQRTAMALRSSTDRGATWSEPRVVAPGPAGYSDLCVDAAGRLHLLWERGDDSPYEEIRHHSWAPEALPGLLTGA